MSSNPLPKIVDDLPLLPARDAAVHKHMLGRIGIIAGSRCMSGAAVLCGLGALRGGAGLVRVFCAESIVPLVSSAEPSLMTVALRETKDGEIRAHAVKLAEEQLKWPTVIAAGPGIGLGEEQAALIRNLITAFPGPMIVDADGLNGLAGPGGESWLEAEREEPIVLTPHAGEFNRLARTFGIDPLADSSDEARIRAAHALSSRTETIVVLKGPRTVVCTPRQAYVNSTGNPGMAAGGMGDVLTGLIAALIGQGMPAFDACRLAVHVHGLAGDRLAKQIGPVGFLARELADELPAAILAALPGRIGFR
ncbi:MAG: hypothetical protein AMXMBFR47_27110 [Planctomycetota bacterium]